MDEPTDHITLMIETQDEGLADEARQYFDADDISEASNFIGGISLAVFLAISAKSLHATLKTILEFLAGRGNRYEDANVVIDGRKLTLRGYSPDDIEKLVKLPIFDRFR